MSLITRVSTGQRADACLHVFNLMRSDGPGVYRYSWSGESFGTYIYTCPVCGKRKVHRAVMSSLDTTNRPVVPIEERYVKCGALAESDINTIAPGEVPPYVIR